MKEPGETGAIKNSLFMLILEENIKNNRDWTQSANKQILGYSFSLLPRSWNIDDIANIETVKHKLEETYWSMKWFRNSATWSLASNLHLVSKANGFNSLLFQKLFSITVTVMNFLHQPTPNTSSEGVFIQNAKTLCKISDRNKYLLTINVSFTLIETDSLENREPINDAINSCCAGWSELKRSTGGRCCKSVFQLFSTDPMRWFSAIAGPSLMLMWYALTCKTVVLFCSAHLQQMVRNFGLTHDKSTRFLACFVTTLVLVFDVSVASLTSHRSLCTWRN